MEFKNYIFSIFLSSIFISSISAQDIIQNDSKKVLLTTELGTNLLENLNRSLVVASTTSCRKEQKSVITDRTWRAIKRAIANGDLQQGISGIPLQARDELPSGGKNSTFTFYGKGATFKSGGVDTIMRMRSRFYLQLFKPRGKLEVKRSPLTANDGWLEIKVKNPDADKILGVNKFRIKLDDSDFLSLFNSDPFSPSFDGLIEGMIQRASEKSGNNPSEVRAILSTLRTVAKIDPNFIRPQYAVSYEREAFKHVEDNYQPLSGQTGTSVEYQITVDHNVTYYSSGVQAGDRQLRLEDYYPPENNKIVGRYPVRGKAIEFKDPFPVANLPRAQMSKIHDFFYDDLVETMQDSQFVVKTFKINRGKAANYEKITGQ